MGSFVVNEIEIPTGKYLNETTLHCKEGYRTKSKNNNTFMTWKVTCDSEGNWSPLLGCEKKGTCPFILFIVFLSYILTEILYLICVLNTIAILVITTPLCKGQFIALLSYIIITVARDCFN